MSKYSYLNQKLQKYVEQEENVVESFKQGLKQALKDQGCTIVNKNSYTDDEICTINVPNINMNKIESIIDKDNLELDSNAFTIRCKDLSRYNLPNPASIYAEIELKGYDNNDNLTFIPIQSDMFSYTTETDFKDTAKTILQNINDLVDNFEDYYLEPDWTELTLSNEQDKKEYYDTCNDFYINL